MLLQIIPDHVKNSWNEWSLESLVLISIASQIVLFLLGNLRKHNPRTRIRIALWCAYLLAYSVVAGALSGITRTALDVCNISKRNSETEKLNTGELMSFWAPFLILHLGGPDTITAYSLEDNELWLRRLAEVVFQSGVALYILLLSLPGCNSDLPLLSILVYITGFIKCFERIQALRLANSEHLRDSMLGSPDPGPNYPKFLEDYHLRKSQGFNVSIEEVPEAQFPVDNHTYLEAKGNVISEAYALFQTFKRIFVDLILTFEDRDNSQSYFRNLKSTDAFTAVEIELGFAYDMLYTKARVVYTFFGLLIRLTSVFFVFMVFVGFCFLCNVGDYKLIHIVITYLLLANELITEIFAVITMLRSDWTDVWLTSHGYSRNDLIFPFLKQPTKRRWSNSIAQLDLISVSLEEKPARLLTAQNLLGIDKYRLKHRYKTYTKVSDKLKALIYNQFHEFMNCSPDPKALCSHKGSFSLRENGCDNLLWSITKVEFDQSIILWHIATTLCYYSEDQEENENEIDDFCLASKHICDYMLYLLVSYPVMLPIGIGMIRYRDTCAEATRYFKENGPITNKVEACRKLLEVRSLEVLPSKVKGDRCKSALFDGCRLALTLRSMDKKHMWEVMSQVWIEILAYAATHCRGFQHQQQLRKGGEFLTHVWLLMAHLGITEQFQVSQGHARARLVVN
ncbi:hypothetical protein SSX86_019910 [Deinandra increscens subsp. villosa]|uniref:DUF4220 domain-containing protein n=1 Tax=Deinandra increscens subsp. villosa TaxID=3103831 RepID=A0AAP0CV65_9ASTR